MNIIEKELKIVEIILRDNVIFGKKKVVVCLFLTGRDIRINKIGGEQLYFKNEPNLLDTSRKNTDRPIRELFCEILIYYAEGGEIYSDVEFEINPDGSYTSRYWFDEARLYKEEYKSAMLTAKDFPHAEANSLVNHQLAYKQKFKRKFERIVLTYWIKDGLPYFELYSINKKSQKLPIELDDEYIKNTNDILKKHYEATNNGILKEVWKPWNNIVIRIPPNGYLDEKEDIDYYLDDVLLSKDFFLRGY
jgi:hypothetical protein